MQKEKTKKIEEIKDDISQNLQKIFKNYKISLRDEIVFITGVLIILIDDKVVNRYLIEVEMPDFKNNHYPIVKEIGGKIPHFASRHVNKSGTSCLFYPDDFKKHYQRDTRLSEFIKGPIFTYFVAQTYYDIENRWIFEEWEHNDFGAYEYYSEKFNTKNFQTIINFIKFILEEKHIKKGEVCLCDSEKRFRNCHYSDLLKIRSDVPKLLLKLSLKRVERFYADIKTKVENENVLKKAVSQSKDREKIDFSTQWYNVNSFSAIQGYFTTKFPPKINKQL